MKLIFIDTETGWLDCNKNALLTIAYAITDELYNILSEAEYKVPINGTVENKAIELNGLDVKNREPNSTVGGVINEIIQKIWDEEESCMIGHNIQFDMWFLKQQAPEEFSKLIDKTQRNSICSKSMACDLKLKWVDYPSTSLHKILKNDEIHTALWDVHLNIELKKKLDKEYEDYCFQKILDSFKL